MRFWDLRGPPALRLLWTGPGWPWRCPAGWSFLWGTESRPPCGENSTQSEEATVWIAGETVVLEAGSSIRIRITDLKTKNRVKTSQVLISAGRKTAKPWENQEKRKDAQHRIWLPWKRLGLLMEANKQNISWFCLVSFSWCWSYQARCSDQNQPDGLILLPLLFEEGLP